MDNSIPLMRLESTTLRLHAESSNRWATGMWHFRYNWLHFISYSMSICAQITCFHGVCLWVVLVPIKGSPIKVGKLNLNNWINIFYRCHQWWKWIRKCAIFFFNEAQNTPIIRIVDTKSHLQSMAEQGCSKRMCCMPSLISYCAQRSRWTLS